MQSTGTISLLQFLSPLRLAGPVFDKELRVASRRPRSYGLRAGYLALLTIVILSAWCRTLALQNPATAFGVSRLAYVAWRTTATVSAFQFVAAQLLMAAFLSSSLGSEIRSGALGVLLTTPTTSWHIMMGKLFSGLLQVVQLLMVSLPVLAVVRMFGGVSWGSVCASFCITITAAIFAGTIGLLLSTYWHHPYDAISAGAIVYLFLWVVVPAVATTALAATRLLSQPMTQAVLDLTNPFRAMYASGVWAWPMPSGGQRHFFSWLVHCLFMGGAAAIVLALATRRLRRSVTANAFWRYHDEPSRSDTERSAGAGWVGPCSRRWWRRGNVAIGVTALAVCSLILMSDTAGLRGIQVYAYYFAWGLWTVALLRVAVSVAGAIAGEKESGAWPVLLTTPLDDDQILRHKAGAGLRNNAILLISAQAVEICFLATASPSKVLSVGQGVLSAVASIFLVVAAGLYFGVRLRSTTTAVVATLGTYLCVNYVVCGHYNPLFGWMFSQLLYNSRHTSTHLALLGFGMGSVALVLDATLGVFFVRQAVRTMRVNIF